MPPVNNILEQVLSHLTAKGLYPDPTWIQNIVSTQKPNTPIQAVMRTALFRYLSSDLQSTSKVSPTTTLPTDSISPTVLDRRVTGPVAVQVLDIDDIGRSRYSQIEGIEAIEKGETTKGREIIRTIPSEAGSSDQVTTTSRGPFKLLLQDARGFKIYGFELEPIEKLDSSLEIGAKLVLRNASLNRGVFMLDASSTTVLGGKVEAMHTTWKQNLKSKLENAISQQDE